MQIYYASEYKTFCLYIRLLAAQEKVASFFLQISYCASILSHKYFIITKVAGLTQCLHYFTLTFI